MLKAEIIKDKKAEKLIAEMKGANSIDQVKIWQMQLAIL